MKHKILITGASGLIGTHLTALLFERGHDVVHLGRSKKGGNIKSYVWDIDKNYLDHEALEGVDTIIHLAGAGIADKRWTESRKKEILESRTKSSQLIFQALKSYKHNVQCVVGASAIGYYGFEDNNTVFDESHPHGGDFLARVVKQWEDKVDQINLLNVRVVKVRVGIVLSDKGGALKEMARPVKLNVGAPLGSGEQYLSWIHIDDLCKIFIKAVEDSDMAGAYNAVAPNPVTNKQLTIAIANAMKKPLILPSVPSFVLKLMLGEMADLVLKGNKVSARKIQSQGFKFKYEVVQTALKDLFADGNSVK